MENGLLILALSTNRLHTQNKCFPFFLPFKINEPEKINLWYAKWRTTTTTATKLPKLTDWLTHSIAISIALLRWRNNGQRMEKTKRELTGWLQSDWLKVSIIIFWAHSFHTYRIKRNKRCGRKSFLSVQFTAVIGHNCNDIAFSLGWGKKVPSSTLCRCFFNLVSSQA